MEKDNFDEELKNRIKQVFEEYDDGQANEGWSRLREKYPEKNRRKYIFWWIASIAILLLSVLTFWLLQSNVNKNRFTIKTTQKVTDSTNFLSDAHLSVQKFIPSKTSSNLVDHQKVPVKTASIFQSKSLSDKNQSSKKETIINTSNAQKTLVKTASSSNLKMLLVENQKVSSTLNKQKIQVTATTNPAKNTSFTDTKSNTDSTITQVELLTMSSADSYKKKQIIAEKKDTSSLITKPTHTSEVAKTATVKKPNKKNPKVILNVFAGLHLNFAKVSDNKFGLGAGFSSNFRLSQRFKLSTGLGLLQNNLTYDQSISGKSLDAANNTYNSAGPGTSVSIQTPSLSSMDAKLISLDIPVNLTYQLLPGKKSFVVSAGLSSNTFVKEVYNYHYNTSSGPTQNLESNKSFSNFNFVKTLNFSAGFAYPLGKNTIQVEPFLKYPLGGMGSQKLMFGSAGINLKLNIQSFKK